MELPAASVEYRPRPHTEPQFASTHVCSVDATTRSADPRRHVTVRPLKPNVEPRPRADAWTKSHPPSATQIRATDSERGHRPQRPVSHQSQHENSNLNGSHLLVVFFFIPKKGIPKKGILFGILPKKGIPKKSPLFGILDFPCAAVTRTIRRLYCQPQSTIYHSTH